MLSVSMTDNVISYKKSKETLKKAKSLILLCEFGSRAQKWPKIAKKNGSLNRNLLNFFVWVWYILDASWWILMSRRFRICVAKGVRGRFRLSYGGGRSVPYFPKNSCECGVTKNRYGHNFQNIASKTNQRWLINYDKPLINFGTDILKIVAVSVFL